MLILQRVPHVWANSPFQLPLSTPNAKESADKEAKHSPRPSRRTMEKLQETKEEEEEVVIPGKEQKFIQDRWAYRTEIISLWEKDCHGKNDPYKVRSEFNDGFGRSTRVNRRIPEKFLHDVRYRIVLKVELRMLIVHMPPPPPKFPVKPKPPSKHQLLMEQIKASIEADKLKPKKEIKARVSLLPPPRAPPVAQQNENTTDPSSADICAQLRLHA
ncbi:unnamed protein product [Nippostrongylus brasiliensis]|uniref:Uncharacterized protein n=1 Tax=Nippostrongylus brasiliensis TaxID=27835 RepID=A0A0N4XUB7_NIPBR|nr:unnamed protein product [Nippostrongylus brasiliensis]